MRYKIEINLLALQQLKSKINLEEAVLLDYLYWLCTSPSEEVENMRIEKDGKRYTWFDYGYYLKETPILRGKTKATITPKIKHLEEEEFIKTFIDEKTGRKYIALLPKVDTLFRKLNDPVKKTKRPPFRKLNIDKYTNIDNNTNDNINYFIDKFKSVNPSYERLFINNTQRDALKRLLDKYGEEKLEKIIDTLQITNQMKYAPVITTPLELENKMGRLFSFIQQQKNNNKEFII
jgi:DNA-binding MarR family transcriptional regulator